MFSGNINLRDAHEAVSMEPWMLAELRKCANDPVYFAKNYVKITTKDDGVQLFNVWDYQADFINTLKNNRFVCAKWSRQSGKCQLAYSNILIQMQDGTESEVTIGEFFEMIKESQI